MDMVCWIQSLTYLVATVTSCHAYFLPYYDTLGSQESAVSLNNAPVGLYGRTSDPYGEDQEYGASLAGAPVGIYGHRDVRPSSPYYLPFPLDYWPFFYSPDYYQYDYDEPQDFLPLEPDNEPMPEDILPRSFKGSISVASSSGDAVREKTKANAFSVQGTVPSDVISDLLKM